jgi:hypothetical protein
MNENAQKLAARRDLEETAKQFRIGEQQFRIGERFNPYKLFKTGSFIPECICRYRGLSLGAKLVWGRLYRYAGENGDAYPSAGGLARELGIGETQGRSYLRELENQKFIEVDRQNLHYRGDGSGGTCHFHFLVHAAFAGETGEQRKTPPPRRKTEGVPLRKTATPTPSDNRSRRESLPRGSTKERQEVPPVGLLSAVSSVVERSKADEQPTNPKSSDSPAVVASQVEKPKNETPKADLPNTGHQDTPKAKTVSIENGKQFWTAEELAAVRTAVTTLMGHEPRQGFEMACQLSACGEPASSVILLLRGLDGKPDNPSKWENYLLKCIRAAFSATERNHLPEPPAKPLPEHKATVEEINRGIDVLDSLVASYQCPECDGMIQQFQNRVVHVFDGRETDSCPGRVRKGAEHSRRVSLASIARAAIPWLNTNPGEPKGAGQHARPSART